MNKKCEEKIITDIFSEIRRAEIIHPNFPTEFWNHSLIIGEEFGEYQKAIWEWYDSRGGTILDIRKELIQIAAMCIRALLTRGYEERHG